MIAAILLGRPRALWGAGLGLLFALAAASALYFALAIRWPLPRAAWLAEG